MAMPGDAAIASWAHSRCAWLQRLNRLASRPGSAVTGWPWDTVATVDWTDHFTLPDGGRGSNQGVHVFGLRWGKVHTLAIHCDTARLQGYCERMASLGVTEALADPIQDAPHSA